MSKTMSTPFTLLRHLWSFVMSIIFWNVRGLGNPWTIRDLLS